MPTTTQIGKRAAASRLAPKESNRFALFEAMGATMRSASGTLRAASAKSETNSHADQTGSSQRGTGEGVTTSWVL